jgi:hypothetical protein
MPAKVKRMPKLRPPPVVKGPIRCHKCQLLCRDAEHYLNHGCGRLVSTLSEALPR